MTTTLNGRVALVTGASTGLGKAMAFGLAEAGTRVALNYQNNAERAERTMARVCAGVAYHSSTLPSACVTAAPPSSMA